MDSVEERLAHPFYLDMMGLNALRNAGARWDRLVDAGRSASVAEVKQLLAPDHWRPVVMGAWFSLKFDGDEVGDDLLSAVRLCRGSLTAPPLAVALSVVVGDGAVTALSNYVVGDVAASDWSAGFVAAALESLGARAPLVPGDADRDALAGMLGLATRFRQAVRVG